MEAVNHPIFFPKPRSRLQRSSRMQQLSAFLPALNLSPSKSKKSKDIPILRKPPPPDQPSSNRPPTRDAPPEPLHSQDANNAMPPPPKKRLQKTDSPNRLKALPNIFSESPARTATTASAVNGARKSSIIAMIPGQMRSTSSPVSSRPTSFHSGEDSDAGAGSKSRRRSFMPGAKLRSRNTSAESNGQEHGTGAWVNAGEHRIDYNLSLLTSGEKVNIRSIFWCITCSNLPGT